MSGADALYRVPITQSPDCLVSQPNGFSSDRATLNQLVDSLEQLNLENRNVKDCEAQIRNVRADLEYFRQQSEAAATTGRRQEVVAWNRRLKRSKERLRSLKNEKKELVNMCESCLSSTVDILHRLPASQQQHIREGLSGASGP